MTTTYEVTAEREGKWWVFRIPALDTSGQARTLAEIDDEARGIISAWLEIPLEDVATAVEIRGVDKALTEWRAADEADDAARAAAAAAAARRRAVVIDLRRSGMTGSDVARLIGITKQRVSQLEKEPVAGVSYQRTQQLAS